MGVPQATNLTTRLSYIFGCVHDLQYLSIEIWTMNFFEKILCITGFFIVRNFRVVEKTGRENGRLVKGGARLILRKSHKAQTATSQSILRDTRDTGHHKLRLNYVWVRIEIQETS